MNNVRKAYRAWVSTDEASLAFVQFVHYQQDEINRFKLIITDCFRDLEIKLDHQNDPSLNARTAAEYLECIQNSLELLTSRGNWRVDTKLDFDTGTYQWVEDLKQQIKFTTMIDTEVKAIKLYMIKEYVRPELVIESAITASLIMLHNSIENGIDVGYDEIQKKISVMANIVRKSRQYVISCS